MTSAGEYHSFAIKEDGSLWDWGGNDRGQLGDGWAENRLTPIRLGLETNWISVTGGRSHTVAMRRDTSLWAWGWNDFGQVGDGNKTAANGSASRPIKISPDTNWAAVGASYGNSFALKTKGSLWGWGSASSGIIGPPVG